MALFVKRLLLFLLLFTAMLYAFTYVIDHGMQKERDGEYGIWNDIYSGKASTDLLIMGASRAERNISTTVIDSALGINCYNIGIEGWTFPMVNTRFKIYTQHNRLPKYVVYSLDFGTLGSSKELFGFQQFLPYLSDTTIQNGTRGYIGSFTWADIHLPLVKYKGQYTSVKRGLKNFIKAPAPTAETRIKGYSPYIGPWDGTFESFIAAHKDTLEQLGFTPATETEFKEFLKYCNQNNIKLIFVFSPQFYEIHKYYKNEEEIMAAYKAYADDNHSAFLDYRSDSICFDKSNFYNSQHLNKKGAEIFTRKLAADIKNIIVTTSIKNTASNP